MSGQIVYHGTHEDLKVLKGRPADKLDRIGTWFTETPKQALRYGGKAIAFELPDTMKFYRATGHGDKNDFWHVWFDGAVALETFTKEGRGFLSRMLNVSPHYGPHDSWRMYNQMEALYRAGQSGKGVNGLSASEVKRVLGTKLKGEEWDDFWKENFIWNPKYLQAWRAAMQSRGFDGVFLDGIKLDFDDQKRVWIVFDPSGLEAVGEPTMESTNPLRNRRKRKKKRACQVCAHKKGDEPWWFAPFYGKGDGSPSGATMPPWQAPLTAAPGAGPASGAYPGAGGINAPGVPAGPNTGMGPVTASREPDRGIMVEGLTLKDVGVRRTGRVLQESEQPDYEAQTAKWSEALGEPLKWFPDLNHEADSRPRFIAVGPKFYRLRDDEQRIGVLYHEFAHFKRLDMEALADNTLWDLVAAGAFGKQRANGEVDGINGQTTPGENVVEAYSVLIMEPSWLKSKYPQAYEYVRGLASKLGLPLKPWIKI